MRGKTTSETEEDRRQKKAAVRDGNSQHKTAQEGEEK